MTEGGSRSAQDVGQLAVRLRMLVMQRQDAWLDLDLTLPQLRALVAVRRQTGPTVSDLARVLGQRLPATSALVNRLVRAGLLRRVGDRDDHRRVRLELTDEAERMLTAVDRRSAERFAAVLGRMSPQGREALAVALHELIGLLSSDTSEGAGAAAIRTTTETGRG